MYDEAGVRSVEDRGYRTVNDYKHYYPRLLDISPPILARSPNFPTSHGNAKIPELHVKWYPFIAPTRYSLKMLCAKKKNAEAKP